MQRHSRALKGTVPFSATTASPRRPRKLGQSSFRRPLISGYSRRWGDIGLRRSAYTLLEVILVLALTTVILGLIGMAIHVHLGVADKSEGQVEEAQKARTLLQRIAEDLRNAVPYTSATSSSGSASGAASGSSGGTSTASGSLTGSGTSGSTGLQAASGTASEGGSTTSDSPADSGVTIPSGLCGSMRCLQIDTTRRVRPEGQAVVPGGDVSQVVPLADVKTVTYSLGNPGTVSPTERGDTSPDPQGGLYRRELDRAAYACAMQQGQGDILSQAANVAPEIVDMQFTYYDGTTASDTWDSSVEGKLPSAVKVAISLRRSRRRSPGGTSAAADNAAVVVYDILVDLPNAQAQSSQGSGGGSKSASSGGSSQDKSSGSSSSGSSSSGKSSSGKSSSGKSSSGKSTTPSSGQTKQGQAGGGGGNGK
jgi:hypothetical protein